MMKTLWRCTLLYPSTIRSFETIELKEMSNRIGCNSKLLRSYEIKLGKSVNDTASNLLDDWTNPDLHDSF